MAEVIQMDSYFGGVQYAGRPLRSLGLPEWLSNNRLIISKSDRTAAKLKSLLSIIAVLTAPPFPVKINGRRVTWNAIGEQGYKMWIIEKVNDQRWLALDRRRAFDWSNERREFGCMLQIAAASESTVIQRKIAQASRCFLSEAHFLLSLSQKAKRVNIGERNIALSECLQQFKLGVAKLEDAALYLSPNPTLIALFRSDNVQREALTQEEILYAANCFTIELPDLAA